MKNLIIAAVIFSLMGVANSTEARWINDGTRMIPLPEGINMTCAVFYVQAGKKIPIERCMKKEDPKYACIGRILEETVLDKRDLRPADYEYARDECEDKLKQQQK